jgi:phosphate transport system protein
VEAHFNEKLKELNNMILRMSVMVEEAMAGAVRCMTENDIEEAHRIIIEDSRVNRLNEAINDFCTELIALGQPVAGDLRTILTSLQVATDLERMGDHAVHVVKAYIRLTRIPGSTPLFKLPEMIELSLDILRGAIKAYLDGDTSLSRITAEKDAELDVLHDEVLQEGHRTLIHEPEEIDKLTNILFINRFIERFGDHARNICEFAVYKAIGERVHL